MTRESLSFAGRPCTQGRPCIMGIINLTPDSFSDGGRYLSTEAAVAQARKLWADGADLLDLGAESTRPGAQPVPEAMELDRLLEALVAIRAVVPLPISVDTRKAAVMDAAIAAGASMINDVSALEYDPDALAVVAGSTVKICLMHMRGTPETMMQQVIYADLVNDVGSYLAERVAYCAAAGIDRERLILDPGIGFAKTTEGNVQLLRAIPRLRALGYPLLLGLSRKGFLGQLGVEPVAAQRDPASLAAMLWVQAHGGAEIFRVHNVAATRQALDVWAGMDLVPTV